jgi:hypothetical protein
MGRENHLIIGKKTAIALRCGDTENVLTIDDARAIKKLNDLAQRQRDVGLEVSKLLKDHGLFAASDDEATVICRVLA